MRVGYQQSWLMAATWEERPATANWEWLVEIIQMAFGDSRLLAEFSWNMVVLIPKGVGFFKWVGIVDVLWKELSGVINWHIRAAVQFQASRQVG